MQEENCWVSFQQWFSIICYACLLHLLCSMIQRSFLAISQRSFQLSPSQLLYHRITKNKNISFFASQLPVTLIILCCFSSLRHLEFPGFYCKFLPGFPVLRNHLIHHHLRVEENDYLELASFQHPFISIFQNHLPMSFSVFIAFFMRLDI